MSSLKKAIEQDKLDEFIKEHKAEKGDKALFEATLRSMAGKSPEAPEASPQDTDDD